MPSEYHLQTEVCTRDEIACRSHQKQFITESGILLNLSYDLDAFKKID